MCPHQAMGRNKENAGTPRTAGWIPQGGGRPRLWRFFPRFLIGEKSGPAERPRRGRWFAPEKSEKSKAFLFTINKARSARSGPCVLIQENKPPLCKGRWWLYGAPAKAQRKRVWWGEEVRRRERDLPRLSGARRGILSPHRRVGGIDRLTAQVPACQPGGDASRWGFLLSGQKKPKPA